ncbi:MAG: HAD hydrolase-like protein [Desulfobulbaceae bacterium]|jgi:putative hydrolase of the HAD superfamily|nr:HAD hydrolase-like protein [Desulfobulbaceae bacterium]MDY0351063.1 HAD hydrolase-like protein [Desulfobulbaceae bacterium]
MDWSKIDTVLLDMDGTLLDKHFDDYFWEQYVPEHYSLEHDLTVEEARKELLRRYRQVEDTLEWTDLDYWSVQLGLDLPDLKARLAHLIDVHPFVVDFLRFCRGRGKHIHLVTNAHWKTLGIKLAKTEIGSLFDRIVCAEEVGLAKEEVLFWQRLEEMLKFDRTRTLLADDTEKVLFAADRHGIAQLIFVARPSSRKPLTFSRRYPSIEYFIELIPESERRNIREK